MLYTISNAEYDRQVKIQFRDVVKMLRAAIRKFFPKELANIEIRKDAKSFTCYGIEIYPDVLEVPRIGGSMEVAAWAVQTIEYVPGNYEEPESYEDNLIAIFRHRQAIDLFMKTMFDRKLKNYWENLSDTLVEKELDKICSFPPLDN